MSRAISVLIKYPWWKERAVGINKNILRKKHYVDVTIAYREKDGSKAFPGHYFMECEDVEKRWIKNEKGAELHIVKIADFLRERPDENVACRS